MAWRDLAEPTPRSGPAVVATSFVTDILEQLYRCEGQVWVELNHSQTTLRRSKQESLNAFRYSLSLTERLVDSSRSRTTRFSHESDIREPGMTGSSRLNPVDRRRHFGHARTVHAGLRVHCNSCRIMKTAVQRHGGLPHDGHKNDSDRLDSAQ